MKRLSAALLLLSAAGASAQSPASVNTTAASEAAAAKQAQTAAAPQGQAKVLDSVVAIVNGDVLLESDVQQEQRLESLQMLPANENTTANAAKHLITRTLILQQMKDQQANPDIGDTQVNKVLDEIRKDLPGCAAAHCETASGWSEFLSARGLSPDEVEDSWRQRLGILDYLNLRFRSGIRIPSADVQSYYLTKMVPEFEKKNQAPPPLKSLAPRIQEVLLQQQVTKQIDDWEQTLRQEGTVQILVPAYGESSDGDGGDLGGGA